MDKSILIYHRLNNVSLALGSRSISIKTMIWLGFTNEHKIYNRNKDKIGIDKYFKSILKWNTNGSGNYYNTWSIANRIREGD